MVEGMTTFPGNKPWGQWTPEQWAEEFYNWFHNEA